VSAAVGLDPSPIFVAKAQEQSPDLASITFVTADGRCLPFGAASFHAVVFHTTLCHVAEPQTVLDEAVRVLRPGGCLAVFEGFALYVASQFEKNAPALNTVEIWDIVNDPEWGSYRRYASVFHYFVRKASIQQLTKMAAKVEFLDWLLEIRR
jgi:ubiquinone/menaquinone biosynthesis C-methylase UbiE